MSTFLIILGVIVVICIVAVVFIKPSPSEQELLLAEKAKKETENTNLLESKYGKQDLSFDKYGFHLRVFPASKTIVIYNHDIEERTAILYEDLVSCEVEVSSVKTGQKYIPAINETTYTTKTSGKSIAGRALVGAVIAGPVGAVIGGVTAKKETTSVTTNKPERKYDTYSTSCNAIIKFLQEGKENSIIYQAYKIDNAKKVKSIIDNIISTRDIQIEKTNI